MSAENSAENSDWSFMMAPVQGDELVGMVCSYENTFENTFYMRTHSI